MPKSRSRSLERSKKSRDKRSRSRNRRSRSRDKRSRSRDKRRDRSRSRDRHSKRDRRERSRSKDRHRQKDRSRDRRRDRSTSRSKKQHQSPEKPSTSSTSNQQNVKIIELVPNHKRIRKSPTPDRRNTFDIADEFSREGFEEFSREHGIDFNSVDTDDDRNAVHEKMEELLKAHFAAQGKVYPPPKVEKPAINAATGFANDGSFLEQFKKMQDDYKLQLENEKKRKAAEERLRGLPIRRRGGGKVLKTGIVAKTKLNADGSEAAPTDPWSMYIKEVQKYKNSSCDSDSKTRPLVK